MRTKAISDCSLFAIFFFFIGCMWAGENHFTKSIHWPSDGDKVSKKHYEYIKPVNDSLSVWDFSKAIETGKSHSMQWINVGDSILVKKEMGAQLTYNVENTEITLKSYETPLLKLNDSIPLSLNIKRGAKQCQSVPFSLQGAYCDNNYVSYNGLLYTDISDRGILILPNDTIEDAVRVTQKLEGDMFVSDNKRLDLKNGSNGVDNGLTHVVVIDKWYSPSFKYELVENLSDLYYFNNEVVRESYATFMCPPEDQVSCLNMAPGPNCPVKTRSTRKGKCHDNDSDGQMNNFDNSVTVIFKDGVIYVKIIDYSNDNVEHASGVLCDQLGRVWKTFSEINFADGEWQTPIYTSELQQGNYVLYLSVGKARISKKLVIQ